MALDSCNSMGHFELVFLFLIFEDFILVPLVNEEEKRKGRC
jgi:hypothetical protein